MFLGPYKILATFQNSLDILITTTKELSELPLMI